MRRGQYIGYLLDIIIALAIFSLSALITRRVFNIEADSSLLVLMFMQIILYRQLKDKINLNIAIKFFVMLGLIVVSIIINGGYNFIDNIILIGLQGALISYFDSKDINKEYYFSLTVKIFAILMFCAFFQLGMKKEFIAFINKIYVLMLVLALILLRAVRNYESKIEEKNEKIKIVGIMLLVPILANEYIYAIILSIFKNFYKGIMYGLTIIITIVLYPIIMLLDFITSGISNDKVMELVKNPGGGEMLRDISDTGAAPRIFDLIIIIVGIVAIYFVFSILLNKSKRNVDAGGEIIIREPLEDIDIKKRNIKANLYKDKDNRTVVKKIFYDIIYRLDRKEMYKKSNTATEVVSKASIYKEDINSIERIYNKAKFSKASITDQDVLIMKEEYTKIRKDLKVKVK